MRSQPATPRHTGWIRRLALLAVSWAALSSPSAWAQQAFDLVQLMQLLGQVKSGEAVFTEKRTSTMLDRPLELSGRLTFEAPDSFTRETLKPTQERMAVTGNQMTLSRGSRSRTVAVDSVPEASVIVEAIRGTLTGNRDSLEKHFSVAVSGSAAQWAIELVPREPRLKEQISLLRLAGQQSKVREVAVHMSDGDRSVMAIEPMAVTPKAASAAK